MRKEDAEDVVATSAQLVFGKAFVLKELKIRTVVERDRINFEVSGKIDEENLFRSGECAEINAGARIQRIVGMDGGVDAVMKSMETRGRRSDSRERVGGPNIVVGSVVDDARLPEEEIFGTHLIDEDIERTGESAIQASMKEMALGRIIFLKEDAEGMTGVKAFDLGEPNGDESVVRLGSDAFALKLA